MKKKCEKGIHNSKGQEVRANRWKKDDDGIQYPWNKIGKVKDYEFTCADCGENQHFLPMI